MKKANKTTKSAPKCFEIKNNVTLDGSNKTIYYFLFFLLLVVVILFKRIGNESNKNKFKNQIIPSAVKKIINNPNIKFNVGDVKETNGVYEFELTIGTGSGAPKYTSYITKDGKVLFTSGIKIDTLTTKQSTPSTQQKKLSCNDLPKAETPRLTAFIVSNCPYGLQMQRVFKKAIAEVPTLSSYLDIKYIGSVDNDKITSMHGDKEAQENLRQICIREEQKDLYWNYVSCYMLEGKTDECLNTTGVDNNQLNACMTDESRGLKYAKADFNLANKFNIGGSPTLLLNEKQIVSEFDFGGRVPHTIKEILCCGSKTKPDFCQKDLSKEQVAPSFSKTDEAPTDSNLTSGGCGN